MGIEIEYKGVEFEFESIPTDEELEARYKSRRLDPTTIRMPVPEAPELDRKRGPLESAPLSGGRVALWTRPDSSMAAPLTELLVSMGASVHVPDNVAASASDAERLVAFDETVGEKVDGLVVDGSTLEGTRDLDSICEFVNTHVPKLEENGRVVVLGRPTEQADSRGQAAAWQALEGFTRSVSQKIGSEGSTANLLKVERGAEEHLDGPMRFFGTARTGFISGQALQVSARSGLHPDGDKSDKVLDGKTALITGAARGIGRATAKLFAKEGAEVVCLDLPDEKLDGIVQETDGVRLPLDISEESAPEQLNEVAREHGGLDVLVHNAGILAGRGMEMDELDRETWAKTMTVNLEAPIRLTEGLLEEGLLNNWGRIVIMSSVAGLVGNLREANYTTSKAGLIGMMQHYAGHLAEQHITANTIAPGHIETRLSADMPQQLGQLSRRFCSLTQGGWPVDVGNAATFLASPAAQGINGQILRVCGDSLIGR